MTRSMNTQKPTSKVNALGLAYKAGALITGEKRVLSQLATLKMLILASDAAPNITQKVLKKVQFYHIPLIHTWNKLTLSQSIPGTPVLIGVTQASFISQLKKEASDGQKTNTSVQRS